MALVDLHNGLYWNQYIQPTQPIPAETTKINSLSLGIDNRLCYKGFECQNVVSAAEGIERFLEHLTLNYPDGVILIAHNGETFDFPLLRKYLLKYSMNRSIENICKEIMCIDSLWAFKKHYQGLISYKQDRLIEIFRDSCSQKDAHEALGDCINLSTAIKIAAMKKNLSVSQFLGEMTHKLPIHYF